MRGNRARADLQLVNNLLVLTASPQELQDFLFPVRKPVCLSDRRTALLEELDDLPSHYAGHGGAPRMNLAQRFQEDCPIGSLEEVAGRSRRQRFEHKVGVAIGGEHDELSFWGLGFQAPNALDPAASRQINVHQHNVRAFKEQGFFGLLCITILANTGESWRLVNPVGPEAPGHSIIIYDGSADQHGKGMYQLLEVPAIVCLDDTADPGDGAAGPAASLRIEKRTRVP